MVSLSEYLENIRKIITLKTGLNIDNLTGHITGYKNIENGKKFEITIKNKNGKIENKIINNNFILPNVTLLPHVGSLLPIEKDMYQKENAFFVKDVNILDISQSTILTSYESIISKMNEPLKKFRLRDLGALRYAAIICKWEDEHATEKELEPMRKHLSDIYSGSIRGHTIYNWLRCGEVFNQEVFPKIDFCKNITNNDADFEKSFFELFWDARLVFHPTKIFVGRYMADFELRWEIRRRFDEDETINEIKVYARRKKIIYADKTIKSLLKSRKNLIYEAIDYTLGDSPARTYTIKRKV